MRNSIARFSLMLSLMAATCALTACACNLEGNGDARFQGPTPLGQAASVGDYEVSAIQVVDPFSPTSKTSFSKDYQAGRTRLIGVEVEVANQSKREALSINSLRWQLFDDASRNHTAVYPGNYVKQPAISETVLTPGNRVRGWITFELPADARAHRVQFREDFLSDRVAEFLISP